MMIPNKIILHHSATKDSGTVSWNAIRRYHVKENKWTDIGYHYGIEFVMDPGDSHGSYEILIGRMPNEVGAHASGQNSQSIGVCFVGNFDTEPPPKEQWEMGLKLVRWLLREFAISSASVFGHRDFADKTCPGLMFNVEKFRREL